MSNATATECPTWCVSHEGGQHFGPAVEVEIETGDRSRPETLTATPIVGEDGPAVWLETAGGQSFTVSREAWDVLREVSL